MTTGAALLDEAEKKSQKIEVHLPRSSRAFVARAERLFELLKVHRQLIQQVPGSVKETLLSSLDMIQVHVLNCERKRMEWEELIATNLSDMQSKCIKALHFSLAAGGLTSAFNMHDEKFAAKHHVADMAVRRQSDRRGGKWKGQE